MPVIAAVGLIGSAAAIAGGTLTVLETIAAVGTIVSSVGALTGNKTLMKIGAVAGLAGGIGAFAQSQGWLSSASAAETAANAGNEASAIEAMKNTASGAEFDVAASSMNPNDAALAAGTKASPLEPEQLDMGAAANEATSGLANTQSITDTITQASPELAKTMGAGPSPGGLIDAANPTDMRLADGVQQSPMQSVNAPDATTLGAGSDPAAITNANDSQLQAGTKVTPGATTSDQLTADAKSGGTKIMDLFNSIFRDKDGKLNKDMLSMAGNFVGGALDGEKAAREELYKTRAEAEKQQMANANAVPSMNFRAAPKASGTFRPTQPTYQPVRVGGLMNAR